MVSLNPLFHSLHSFFSYLAFNLVSNLWFSRIYLISRILIFIKMLEFLHDIIVQNIWIFCYKLLQINKILQLKIFFLWFIYFTQWELYNTAFCASQCFFQPNIYLFEFSLFNFLSYTLEILIAYFCLDLIINCKSKCFLWQHQINLLSYQLLLFRFNPAFSKIAVRIPSV